MSQEAYLIGGVRTPFGRFRGALAGTRPDDLAAIVLEAALDRAGVPHDERLSIAEAVADRVGTNTADYVRLRFIIRKP